MPSCARDECCARPLLADPAALRVQRPRAGRACRARHDRHVARGSRRLLWRDGGGDADARRHRDARVRFETAISPAPITLPAHATLLTGLDPPDHGVRNNGMFRLVDESRARRADAPGGFATAAFVAALVLDPRFGLERGFDPYDDRIGPTEPPRPSRATRAPPTAPSTRRSPRSTPRPSASCSGSISTTRTTSTARPSPSRRLRARRTTVRSPSRTPSSGASSAACASVGATRRS